MEKEVNNLKKITLSILGVFVLVIVVIGVTYAAFVFTGTGAKQNTIQSGSIVMTYTENTNGISITNAQPMTDGVGKILANTNEKFEFTVGATITGTATINYEIAAIKDVSSTLLDNEVKLYLEKNGMQVAAPKNFTPIASATTIGSPTGSMILDSGTFTTSTTNNYVLRMWVADTYTVAGTSKSYTVKVNVYGKDIAGGAGEAAVPIVNGTPVYFNPETGTKCTESNYNANSGASDTGNKSGCMKWYAFNSNNTDSTANLLLDHNTTGALGWSDSNNQLLADVVHWDSTIKTTARLISVDEIAQITGHPTFNSTQSGQDKYYFDTNTTTASPTCTIGNTSGCRYGWLYDRTRTDCTTYGCSNNATQPHYGYWTSSPDIDAGGRWAVYYRGQLDSLNSGGGSTSVFGLRPVISVLKSSL